MKRIILLLFVLCTISSHAQLTPWIYYNNGMYQQCIHEMDNIISRNRDEGKLYYLRGLAKVALYKNETGCPDLKRAYELGIREAQEVRLRHCKLNYK